MSYPMSKLNQALASAAFPTTRWSLVLAAGDTEADRGRARLALEELCAIYWRPVYSFVRARGKGREDAEDLTQGFIASLLERGTFSLADRERGKMRSYLRVALKRFVINQDARSHALKRGGRDAPLSLEVDLLEERLGDVNAIDPERAFEQQWALALLGEVLRSLGEEYAQAGKAEVFAVLRDSLSVEGEGAGREELAARLQMTDGAVRVAVFRLRRRYRELLRGAIAATVEAESDIDGEIEYLMGLFSTGYRPV